MCPRYPCPGRANDLTTPLPFRKGPVLFHTFSHLHCPHGRLPGSDSWESADLGAWAQDPPGATTDPGLPARGSGATARDGSGGRDHGNKASPEIPSKKQTQAQSFAAFCVSGNALAHTGFPRNRSTEEIGRPQPRHTSLVLLTGPKSEKDRRKETHPEREGKDQEESSLASPGSPTTRLWLKKTELFLPPNAQPSLPFMAWEDAIYSHRDGLAPNP